MAQAGGTNQSQQHFASLCKMAFTTVTTACEATAGRHPLRRSRSSIRSSGIHGRPTPPPLRTRVQAPGTTLGGLFRSPSALALAHPTVLLLRGVWVGVRWLAWARVLPRGVVWYLFVSASKRFGSVLAGWKSMLSSRQRLSMWPMCALARVRSSVHEGQQRRKGATGDVLSAASFRPRARVTRWGDEFAEELKRTCLVCATAEHSMNNNKWSVGVVTSSQPKLHVGRKRERPSGGKNGLKGLQRLPRRGVPLRHATPCTSGRKLRRAAGPTPIMPPRETN